ncbi:MAG: phosphoribosyl-AMP cyclohydrolase [bacterium]|nr:phosphoribosyl-AMP cyclohydrolase [bacterium]
MSAHSHSHLEESTELQLDFTKLSGVAATGAAVLPVVVQHADSREVLIVAYANQAALDESRKTGVATLWSTSRNELWVKGATSGDYLDLIEIRVNCEQNSLLYLVRPREGGVCHTKDARGAARTSCYYRRLAPDSANPARLEFL